MTKPGPDRRTVLAAAAASCFVAATARAQWNDLIKKGESLLRKGDTRDGKNGGVILTDLEINRGLKEALRIGSTRVIKRVGRVDGYNDDPKIHIPLPTSLRSVKYALNHAGAGSIMDKLEVRMNRAAEAAAPKAKRIFFSAIQQMTLEDARQILGGRDDSATRYFERKMTPDLKVEMRPVVDSTLSEVGALQAYGEAMALYNKIPIAPKLNPDLTGHVVEKAIEGIFYYLAREEEAIRRNPVKRSTAILRRVFGNA